MTPPPISGETRRISRRKDWNPKTTTAPPRRPGRRRRMRAGRPVMWPDIDDFDIGIDLDEELTRALEEQLEPDSDIDRGATALERALAPAGESGAGPARSRSELGPVPGARSDLVSGAGDEDIAVDLGGRRIGEPEEAGPVREGDRQRTSARRSGAVDPLEGGRRGRGWRGSVRAMSTSSRPSSTWLRPTSTWRTSRMPARCCARCKPRADSNSGRLPGIWPASFPEASLLRPPVS